MTSSAVPATPPPPALTDLPSHGVFSPEGVQLDLPLAGPAPRILAYVIDFAIITGLMILLLMVLFASLPGGASLDRWLQAVWRQSVRVAPGHNPHETAGRAVGIILAIFVLAQFVIESGYFIFWEMVTNGRSPGKALVGLRTVGRDGAPLTLRGSVIRNVMRIADMLPASYVAGLITMIVSASGERLGDHAAGTLVVRLDRPEAAAPLELDAETAATPFTGAQLARIGIREQQLIRGTLRRLEQLPAMRRAELVAEVAETIRVRMELAEVPGHDGAAFLRGVWQMAERYARRGPR